MAPNPPCRWVLADGLTVLPFLPYLLFLYQACPTGLFPGRAAPYRAQNVKPAEI